MAITLGFSMPALAQPGADPNAKAEAVPGIAGRVDGRVSVQVNQSDASGFVVIDLKSAHRVWSLMGEPVAYCTASWSLVNLGMVTLHGKDGQQRPLGGLQVPPEVLREVGLIDVKMTIPLHERSAPRHGAPRYYVPCDMGVMNRGGDPAGSFNVPGSPDWKRFALHDRFKILPSPQHWDFEGNYADVGEAKAMLKAGTSRYEIRNALGGEIPARYVLRMAFDFEPVRTWLRAQESAQVAKQREQRQREIRQALAASKDPFEQMLGEVEATQARQQPAAQTQSTGSTSAAAPLTEQLQAVAAASAKDRQARRERLAAKGCVVEPAAGADLQAAGGKAQAAYARCQDGADALEPFTADRMLGYRSANGTVRITPRFWRAEPFSDGLAWTASPECGKEHFCAIDTRGETVLRLASKGSDIPGPFNAGLSLVRERGKTGYIDSTGRFVIEPVYEEGMDFSEGLAPVNGGPCKFNMVCWIDPAGQAQLTLRYAGGWPFDGGMAQVVKQSRDGKRTYGFIDRQGREVIEPIYELIYDERFHEGLVRATGGDCGRSTCFLDRTGNAVLKVSGKVDVFSDGLAAKADDDAANANRQGYIDRSGRFVIPGKFWAAGRFRNGVAQVSVRTGLDDSDRCGAGVISYFQSGRIDRQGRWLEPPTERSSQQKMVCLSSGR